MSATIQPPPVYDSKKDTFGMLGWLQSLYRWIKNPQLAVPDGGTGDTSFTAYTPVCGGTTSTGPLQSVASTGTSGQLLTSNGAGALPTFQTLVVSSVPTGSVFPYAGSTAPSGYLICDGSAVDRTTYATLFALIGTTYGAGNGTTTFNVPDVTGRVVAGKEATATRLTVAVSGINGGTLGASGGNENLHQHTHTATVTDPHHSHTNNLTGTNSWASGPTGGDNIYDGTSQTSSPNDGGACAMNTAATGITVANANAGTGSSQNVQPTIVLNYIIKT